MWGGVWGTTYFLLGVKRETAAVVPKMWENFRGSFASFLKFIFICTGVAFICIHVHHVQCKHATHGG